MEACVTYLRISAYSYPAIAIYNAGAAIYRSMGKPNVPMSLSLAANGINVAGNAIGVFLLHAGVAGVAYPSLISRSFSGVVIIILCFKKSNEIYLVWKKILCWKGNMIRKILGIAVPNGIENGLFQLIKVALSSITALFGTIQIAANGVAQSFWSVAALMGTALGLAFHSDRSVYGGRGPAGGRLLYEKASSDHFPGLCGVEWIDPVYIPSGPSRLCPVSSGEKADLCADPDPQYF